MNKLDALSCLQYNECIGVIEKSISTLLNILYLNQSFQVTF